MRTGTGFFGVTILFVGLLGGWTSAQVYRPKPTIPMPTTTLSGSDIGFRVDGATADGPFGTLVVRMNGEWVPAQISGQHPELIH
jgi:hypothetical protein